MIFFFVDDGLFNGAVFVCRFSGASSSRVSVPPISPQGQRTHVLQPGLPVPAYEANLVSFFQQIEGLRFKFCKMRKRVVVRENSFKNFALNLNLFYTLHLKHGEISGFGSGRIQSPPPAHQQASPITPVIYDHSIVPCSMFLLNYKLQMSHFVFAEPFLFFFFLNRAMVHFHRCPFDAITSCIKNGMETFSLMAAYHTYEGTLMKNRTFD